MSARRSALIDSRNGPAGQAQSVSETSLAIDDHDIEIPFKGEMLKSVVADNHVAMMFIDQKMGASDALRPHHNRNPAASGDQDRFISHFGGGVRRR